MNLEGRTVLVTGSAGFIGSHVVETLVSRGARVRAFTHYRALGSRGWLDALSPATEDALEIVAGDVRDGFSLLDATDGASAVLHLAALVGVPYSYESPASFVATNVTGTLHVLEAARRRAVERVVVVSTSEVYGTARHPPIDEDHPLQAQSPYAASKIGAEKLAEAYARTYGLPVVVARPFNTYGPRQSARAIVPAILGQLLAGAREVHVGNLEPRRDFVFVRDTARALADLLSCDEAIGTVVNVATGVDVSVGELAARIVARVRPGTPVVRDDVRSRPSSSEVERLQGSAARLEALTGARPAVDLDAGLDETIAWYAEPGRVDPRSASAYSI